MVFGNSSKKYVHSAYIKVFYYQVGDYVWVSEFNISVIRLKVFGQDYGSTFTRQKLIFYNHSIWVRDFLFS